MHAVDGNVIVRTLIGDDPAQAAKARTVMGHKPVFVPRTVLMEVEWVLRGVYGLPPERIISALRAFAGLLGVSGCAQATFRWQHRNGAEASLW